MEQINRNFHTRETREAEIQKVVSGLLRAVDPLVDPTHEAHLPAQEELDEMEIKDKNVNFVIVKNDTN